VNKSLSIRIRYYTAENSIGECGLWMAPRTKTELRQMLRRHNIDPGKVFRCEVNKGDGYKELPFEKWREIVDE